jgi:hypothetical protein
VAAGFAEVGQCRVPDAGAVQIAHRRRGYTCRVVMSLRRRDTTTRLDYGVAWKIGWPGFDVKRKKTRMSLYEYIWAT